MQPGREGALYREEVAVWDALWSRVCPDEPLARHTTFRIGGPADFLLSVHNMQELLAVVKVACARGMDFLLLGAGSNVLVSDDGVRGLVILNRASEIRLSFTECGGSAQQIDHQGACSTRCLGGLSGGARRGEGPGVPIGLQVASGVPLGRLVGMAARKGWEGLEWAVGIPGTIGGAIVQNAGAYGGCMADVLLRARVMNREGEVRTLGREQLALGYRTSRFRCGNASEVVLSTDLQLKSGSRAEVTACMAEHLARRKAAQPPLPSAGSVFKNPPGDHAARLIEAAGLKGTRIGDAMVSPKHANFIVNAGHARAVDVKDLIDQVCAVVVERFGTKLEPEVQLVGNWHGSCEQ